LTAEATLPRRTRDFYAIAHRAGNNLHHLEQALDAGVDAIECDMWHYHGKLALRHERKLPALPVLYDRWYLRWSWGVVKLRDLLRTVNFRAELFLDIKSSTPRAADAVLELHHDNEAMLPRTLVSSQQWAVLDKIAAAGTDMRMFYSVGNEKWLDALFARAEREPRPAGTSIRHTLLNADAVRRLPPRLRAGHDDDGHVAVSDRAHARGVRPPRPAVARAAGGGRAARLPRAPCRRVTVLASADARR